MVYILCHQDGAEEEEERGKKHNTYYLLILYYCPQDGAEALQQQRQEQPLPILGTKVVLIKYTTTFVHVQRTCPHSSNTYVRRELR
jgi:hypothetical protein